jgi:enterobacterial common antigen flippase
MAENHISADVVELNPIGDAQPIVIELPRERFSNRRAYAQTFAATAATRCLGLVTGILAARLLGPTGRGELAVIVFLPTVLALVGELELPRSIAVEASQANEVPRTLIATSVWLALILGLVQAAILAAVLPSYLPGDKLHLLSASRMFMLYLPATYLTAALMGSDQGRGRFGRFSLLMVLPGALYAFFLIVVVVRGVRTPQLFAASLLASALLTAAIRVGLDWRSTPLSSPDWQLARRLLGRGMSFYLPAIAGIALSRADMFILVRIAATDQIGLYTVAQAIALGQVGAMLPFVHVGFAAVARERRKEHALAALAHHFRFAQIAAVAMAALAAALTPWGIRTLFGARFLGAIETTYLLIGVTALWGASQMLEQGLRAAGHSRIGIASNLAGLTFILVAGIPACRRYGINGIAAAALASQAGNLFLLIAFCVSRLKMPVLWFWAFDAQSIRELWTVGSDTLTHFFRGRMRYSE